jgi:hypothetical protein
MRPWGGAKSVPSATIRDMRTLRYLAALSILALPSLCLGGRAIEAQEASATGLWQGVDPSTGKVGGWFLIFEKGGIYEGAIVRMFREPGEDPNPICTKCPGDQHNAPWLGLTIIKGMQRKGIEYEHGSILDPRDGTEYHALMHLSPNGQELTVHGYLGLPLLGKDQYWKRLPDAAYVQVDPSLTEGRLPPSETMHPGTASPKARIPNSR